LFVLTCDDFTIRGDDARWGQSFIEFVLVLSVADDLVIQFVGANDFVKFLKSEVVDIFSFTNYLGLGQSFGFSQ
jgi:hypothetical protein